MSPSSAFQKPSTTSTSLHAAFELSYLWNWLSVVIRIVFRGLWNDLAGTRSLASRIQWPLFYQANLRF